MKGYLANGLFTAGDCAVNVAIATSLRKVIPGIDLYVPQENDAINDKNAYADSVTIAQADSKELLESDFLVAVIDGVEIDAGVAAEIGIFSTTGKPIFALYTDIRQLGRDNRRKLDALVEDATENQFMYRNLFVVGLIKQSGGSISPTVPSLINTIKENMK
ncbi:nucleoside 2-deoxyribosyltransferase [Bacillus wiedmannii]|uniref:nucleoside 2-deoxyribosyltransferase n=1 Tax=Bacillus wiedmannii TaxID=1890302 RepID=UPI000BEF324E|nr:nucleoside 2-deoxyribosyltransferase [Bacillus wiedmannii]PEN61646.1 nucleoside 2-deoxyribosyltransferase [Bacillus wiedmannii]PHA62890.1 nucleoside 2-deoxyribosyltransferase [Bacillus wiedmannii]